MGECGLMNYELKIRTRALSLSKGELVERSETIKN